MKELTRLTAILIAAATVAATGVAAAGANQQEQEQMPEYEGKVNAPEFPEGMEWLNTERPLSIRGLRGKVVLLDFWTYCCINCIHIIPDLKRLEAKYADELVVIGVHSAKFYGERETENIRQAMLRYEIEHPVVNDRDMTVWRMYGARAWPTVMLIDPAGKVVGYMSGEGVYEPMDDAIGKVIKRFDERGQLDRKPLNLRLERDRMPASLLAFPGKVLADEKSGQLFIADSNHNRVVVLSLDDHSVKEVIGSGGSGIDDGTFESATFNNPQGMAFDGKSLFVADTGNHAIRSVDLESRIVSTLAGTGEQARPYNSGGPGRETALSSPWDVVLYEGALYIAMAGPHQLWRLDLKTGETRPFAGSGREALIDGPLLRSALAQPSGITTDGKKLYFADSEVSAIRSADIDPRGEVETIVGVDLFEFGDVDGKADDVRLQHPLGVAYHDGAVYVADTYNNKIKRVSPTTRTAETFLGTGEEGLRDGERAAFDEPGGLSIAFGKIYVADTNNHAIRVADLKTRKVETVRIKGLEKLMPRARLSKFAGESVSLAAQKVEPGDAILRIELELPSGFKLNADAPTSVLVSAPESGPVRLDAGPQQILRNPDFPVDMKVKLIEGQGSVEITYSLYYCEADRDTLCFFKEARLAVPLQVSKGSGNRTASARYRLVLPQ